MSSEIETVTGKEWKGREKLVTGNWQSWNALLIQDKPSSGKHVVMFKGKERLQGCAERIINPYYWYICQ